jgi:hypothetical protein
MPPLRSQPCAGFRVEAVSWFVEQPDIGAGEDNTGEGRAFELARREHSHGHIGEVIKRHRCQCRIDLSRFAPIEPRPIAERLFEGQFAIKRALFGKERHGPGHRHRAGMRRKQPGNQAQQAGLARAIGAGDKRRPTGFERKIEPGEQDAISADTAQCGEGERSAQLGSSSNACMSASLRPK